jgi:hypothetical protein
MSMQNRFPPPPPLSLPKDAPWTEAELQIAYLYDIGNKLATLIDLLSPAGGAPSGAPAWQSLPDVVAAQVPLTTNFGPYLNLSSLLLSRLSTLFEDYGVANGGSNSTLYDPTKNWLNDWTDHTLYVYVQSVLYVTTITSNTKTQLNFKPLIQGLTIDNKTVYWIQSNNSSTTSASRYRWGIPVEPTWNYHDPATAPAAGAVLATHTVAKGVSGFIFGFSISVGEANVFLLNWTSGGAAKSKRIVFGAQGSVEEVDQVAMNAGLPADASTDITITNVNPGGAGIVYQADVLVGEV